MEAHKVENPAVTILSALVDHLEAIGHRDMPQVHQARAFLTSLNPPKAEPKVEHPAPKAEHPAAKPAPHSK
jgi:hypothetical protein